MKAPIIALANAFFDTCNFFMFCKKNNPGANGGVNVMFFLRITWFNKPCHRSQLPACFINRK